MLTYALAVDRRCLQAGQNAFSDVCVDDLDLGGIRGSRTTTNQIQYRGHVKFCVWYIIRIVIA